MIADNMNHGGKYLVESELFGQVVGQRKVSIYMKIGQDYDGLYRLINIKTGDILKVEWDREVIEVDI